MVSKIYADNLARSNSDSSRDIVGQSLVMQATERDSSNIHCPYCNKFSHYKNDYADFKAVRQQNQRRSQRKHKQRGGHWSHQPQPGGAAAAEGGGANVVLMPQDYHL